MDLITHLNGAQGQRSQVNTSGAAFRAAPVPGMVVKFAKRGLELHAGPFGVPAAASVLVCCAAWALKQWKRRRQDRSSPPAPARALSPAETQGAVGQWNSVVPHDEQEEAADEAEIFSERQDDASAVASTSDPDPLEMLLYDEVLPLSMKETWAWTQRPLGRVALELHIRKRNRPITATAWQTSGEGKLQRSIEYITPLKKNTFGPSEALCCERKTVEQRHLQGFLVSVDVQTPKVPYGDAFYTRLQIWAQRHAAGQTRLRISGDMCFRRKLLLSSIIRRSTFEGMKSTYEMYAEIMHEQLQQHHRGSGGLGRTPPPLNLRRLQDGSHARLSSRHRGTRVTLNPSAEPRGLQNWQLLGLATLLLVLWRLLRASAAACPLHRDSGAPAGSATALLACLLDRMAACSPDLSWHWHRNL